ncbi:MAG: helix-turn-helix transcriptional regulator [Anaerovoracaceae bacterium]
MEVRTIEIIEKIKGDEINKLKELRETRKLSRSQLAEKSGVNVRTIEAYEQGLKDINKAQGITLYKLANALGCKIEELLILDKD